MRKSTTMNTRHIALAAAAGAALAAPALGADPAAASSIAENVPRFLGRLHPLVVHFPIALLMVAVLFELGSIIFKRERTRPSSAGLACVTLGALGAIVAAWFGWINADLEPHGSGVADLISVHRWLGVGTAAVATIALVAAIIGASGKARGMTSLYRVSLVLAAGLVATSGHWGGTIVYGEGYLTEALFPEPVEEIQPMSPEEVDSLLAEMELAGTTLTVDFASQIAPILERSCVKCHGPTKRKGDLRLDSRHFVFDDRAADEQVIVPGDAEDSELFLRVSLPADDDDVMPPEGKADPLSAEEVGLIETWINEGAIWADVAIVAGAQSDAETEAQTEAEASQQTSFVFDNAARIAQGVAIKRLRDFGAVALPIAQDVPWIEVRLDLLGEQVTDEELKLLSGLQPTLVSLNLAGTAITDEGVATLASYPALERLHLERTAVTDEGVASLASLERLRYLNLYGTAVTDRSLVAVAPLPNLENLFLWQTAVTPQAGALLQALKPGLAVEVASSLVPATFDEPTEETAATEQPAAEEVVAEAPPEPAAAVIDVALLPGCCKAALDAGGECDHECCVAARARGELCPTCSG